MISDFEDHKDMTEGRQRAEGDRKRGGYGKRRVNRNFLQCHVTGSILVVAGPFQWPAPLWNSLPDFIRTWPSVQTVSDVCLRRTCLLDTSALSALEVLWQLLRYINLLTYLLI